MYKIYRFLINDITSFQLHTKIKLYNNFSYAGVAVIDRPKFFLPQRRLFEKNEQFPESDRTEDK